MKLCKLTSKIIQRFIFRDKDSYLRQKERERNSYPPAKWSGKH